MGGNKGLATICDGIRRRRRPDVWSGPSFTLPWLSDDKVRGAFFSFLRQRIRGRSVRVRYTYFANVKRPGYRGTGNPDDGRGTVYTCPAVRQFTPGRIELGRRSACAYGRARVSVRNLRPRLHPYPPGAIRNMRGSSVGTNRIRYEKARGQAPNPSTLFIAAERFRLIHGIGRRRRRPPCSVRLGNR